MYVKPTTHIEYLLETMSSSDENLRFIAVSNLKNNLRKESFELPEDSQHRIVEGVLKLLEDSHGEVQNQAIDCLPPLLDKVKQRSLIIIFNNLTLNLTNIKMTCLKKIFEQFLKQKEVNLPVDNPNALMVHLVNHLIRNKGSKRSKFSLVNRGLKEMIIFGIIVETFSTLRASCRFCLVHIPINKIIKNNLKAPRADIRNAITKFMRVIPCYGKKQCKCSMINTDINSVQEISAKDILLWCQRKTSSYKNINVQNFYTSFKDGLAFCALIHRHHPVLLDYSKLTEDDSLSNLNLAFDIAEKNLNIPKMLDAEEIKNSIEVNEKAVMTYLSSYYSCFCTTQKAEQAASRIYKIVRINQENEQMMAEYERLASDLLEWIKQKRPWLEDRTTNNTLDGTQAKFREFWDYCRSQKPSKSPQKAKLETDFNSLYIRRRLSNRPAFTPTEGKLIANIVEAWTGLELAEKGFEDWLLQELRRFERLHHLAGKFQRKCDIHKEWSAEKTDLLKSTDLKKCSLNDLRTLSREYLASETDLAAHQDRVKQIAAIAQELNVLGCDQITIVNERCQKICNEWDELGDLTQKRRLALTETERIAERIDSLFLEYAEKAAS